MSFLRPDSRKVVLFLAIPVAIVVFILSGPYLFPVGYSSEIIYAIPQILLGSFLALVTAPFTLVAVIFSAAGIDLFYATALIAKAGIAIGIIATVFWWYVISCLIISIYRRFK